MKKLSIFCVVLQIGLLTSCHRPQQTQTNVIEEKSSLIQTWYGKDHFDTPQAEASQESSDATPSQFLTPGGMVTPPPSMQTESTLTEQHVENFFSQFVFDSPQIDLKETP